MNAYEWIGAAMGMAGSLLLCLNTRYSCMGWVLFLLANVSMILFALQIEAWGLLSQQGFFMVTSSIGIFRSRAHVLMRKELSKYINLLTSNG